MTDETTNNLLLLREPAAAQVLGISVSQLRSMRRSHSGPVHVRIGRLVRYRVGDLRKFIEERTVP